MILWFFCKLMKNLSLLVMFFIDGVGYVELKTQWLIHDFYVKWFANHPKERRDR